MGERSNCDIQRIPVQLDVEWATPEGRDKHMKISSWVYSDTAHDELKRLRLGLAAAGAAMGAQFSSVRIQALHADPSVFRSQAAEIIPFPAPGEGD